MNNNANSAEAGPIIRRVWSVGGVTLVAALAGGWYVAAISPAGHQIDALRADARRSFQFLETKQELKLRLEEATTEASRLADQQAEAERRVGEEVDEIGFLAWLTEAAQDAKLNLQDFRPVGFADYGDYQSRKLQLTASGRFEAVCRVLNELRSCPRMNRVTEIALTPTDETRSEFRLSMQIELLSQAT